MKYFKNSDLKKQYGVSYTAINNWIKRAQTNKLDIQLHEEEGKVFIVNTAKNISVIERLIEEGKKYKNTLSHKVIEPKPEFYQFFDYRQIFDLINNLDIHREIPQQYNYFDGGAESWDSYAKRLWEEETPNSLNSTVRLLQTNVVNIDTMLENFERVNVIDIGVGNCLPVKEFLTHLLYETGTLDRYIGIDISPSMLQIAKKNIDEWFGGKINFEGYTRDITHERFDDILTEQTLYSGGNTANVFLYFGGTLSNFRAPDDALRVIYNSMGRNDILLFVKKIDTPRTQRQFDFDIHSPTDNKLPLIFGFAADLLNLDQSFYEVEMGYDPQQRHRFIRLRLKIALTMKFKFNEGERDVNFNKDETILIWRGRHQTSSEVTQQFEKNGFLALQTSLTPEREYMLLAAAIDTPSFPTT